MLITLIKSAKSRSILEWGHFVWLIDLWLADAAHHTDGKVVLRLENSVQNYLTRFNKNSVLYAPIAQIFWTFRWHEFLFGSGT